MNTGPAFWLIMTVGAAVLLGVALAYGLISRRMRRETKRGGGNRRRRSSRGKGDLARTDRERCFRGLSREGNSSDWLL
jgi:hypothetical protein